MPLRVTASAATVAGPDVQVAVRTERHRAAVVVGVGAVFDQHDRAGAALDDIGVGGVGDEPRDHDVAAVARVVHEQPAVGPEVGVEGKAEQPSLPTVLDLRADVHERRDGAAGCDRLDDPALLDDEQPVRPIAGAGDLRRRIEAACDRIQCDRERPEDGQWRGRRPSERRQSENRDDG